MSGVLDINKIYNENCLDTLKRMKSNSINLVVTSPPYAEARKKTYGGIPADEFVAWFKPIGAEIYRVLTTDGSFILNIGDNTVEGETHLYTFELPIMLKKEVGFKFIDPLIWHKKTTPPGRYNNRFKGAWEFCYHFSKNIKIKFNPKAVAQKATDVSVARYLRHKDFHQTRSSTGSGFNNPSGNAVKTTGSLDMLLEALPSNVLHLSPETTNRNHSAPFPLDLPAFFIKALTDEKDTVYDPFFGSGTTGEAAIKLNRYFIGSELLAKNCATATKRLNPFLQQQTLF